MKKIIAVALIIAVFIGVFSLFKKEDIPEDYVTVTSVPGITFSVPATVTSTEKDNEAFANAFLKSKLGSLTEDEMKQKYLYQNASQYGYLSSDDFIIFITPLLNTGLLRNFYDRDSVDKYIESNFPIANVNVKSTAITDIKNTTLSSSIDAVLYSYGKVSGHFYAIESGFNKVGILVFIAPEYANTLDKKEIKKITKTIAESLELGNGELSFYESAETTGENTTEKKVQENLATKDLTDMNTFTEKKSEKAVVYCNNEMNVAVVDLRKNNFKPTIYCDVKQSGRINGVPTYCYEVIINTNGTEDSDPTTMNFEQGQTFVIILSDNSSVPQCRMSETAVEDAINEYL